MTPKKFAFRIKEKDYLLLKKKAAKANITMTDFIIKAITEQKIVVIDSLAPLLSELKAVGRNLNHLTHLLRYFFILLNPYCVLRNQFLYATFSSASILPINR